MCRILEDALSIIKKHCTETQVENFSVVGSGFGSLIIESNQGIIFRIARNLETAKQYVMECKVLPKIKDFFGVNIPNPIWQMFNAASAPYGIMAYRKLKGNPIDADKMNQTNRSVIAKEVTNFIVSIHQIQYEKLNLADIPEIKNDKKTLMLLREETSEFLKSRLTTDESRKVEDWWEEILSDDTFFQYKPTLCHGDMWYENILVDNSYSHVVGVIDFSNMMIGDPAIDLVPQAYLGKEFFHMVLNEYKKVFDDETIGQRIKRHKALREISGLRYVIKNNQTEEYEDSISKIRNEIFLPR